MSKYIDADKLIARINERLMSVNLEELGNNGSHRVWAYNDVKDIISSLQQEKPECSSSLVDVDAVREDFMAEVYRVLDADPTNDRANAIIDAFDSLPTISQEQPEVNLEKEIDAYFDKIGMPVFWCNFEE